MVFSPFGAAADGGTIVGMQITSGTPTPRTRTARRIVALLGSLALAVAGGVAGPVAAAERAKPDFRETGRQANLGAAEVLEATGASSISFAVVSDGKIVWSSSVGVIDDAGTKPSAETLYGIGSVSKLFATTAVMQLVDAGKVSLDAPVTDYITDFRMASPEYRQITVRMLLNHTAGLPGTDYTNAFSPEPYLGYADQILGALTSQRLKTTPGSMAVYCNDCFTLAGILVERVSGQTYPEYVTQNILQPLGMRLSRYGTEVLADGTYARVLADDGLLPAELTSIYASGGLMSTPNEMARFASMLMNDGVLNGTRILSKAAVREMGRSQLPTTLTGPRPAFFTYGLGWDSVAEPGLAAVGQQAWLKGGDTSQYHAGFTVAPQAKLAAVALAAGTNVSSEVLETLSQRILLTALVDKGLLDAFPEPVSKPLPKTVAATAADISNITGIYLAQGAAERVVSLGGNRVSLESYQDGGWVRSPAVFTLRSDGKFWLNGAPPADASALSLSRGWGRTFLIITQTRGSGHYRQEIVLGQKVTSAGSLSPAWQQRVGDVWLMVNSRPQSDDWSALPAVTFTEIPGLPGYLWMSGATAPSPVDTQVSDDLGAMFVTVPNALGRDLNDVQVVAREDGDWLKIGRSVFRPISTVPVLSGPSNTVRIDAADVAEWRTVTSAQTATMRGSGMWKAYSADGVAIGNGTVDGASVALPANAYLALFGAAGSTIDIRLK